MTDQEHVDPFENNIETATEFTYPKETIAPDLWLLVQYHVTQSLATAMTDMLSKIANTVLVADNPRLTLAALFYASDVDLSYVLNCPNTATDIAKKLGVAKQSFGTQLKRVRGDFGLIHSTTINHGVTPETYSDTNARKLK